MPIVGKLVKRAMQVKKRVETPRKESMFYQHKILKNLIKKASQTEFGSHYLFSKILENKNVINSFQEKVPIHDYDKIYKEWWHRTINEESNICWPDKIKYFALSSGTTGSPSKYIPVTDEMIKSMRKAGVRMFYNTTQYDFDDSFYEKQMMMFGGSTNLQQKGGYKAGDLSGINAGRLPLWLRKFYKPGVKISGLNNWNDRIEQIAIEAPKWDIGIVMGIPSWIQLMMERVIEKNNLKHIHEIWPNFQVYVTGGVAFDPYRSGFEKLLGKPVHYMDTYLASEGFLAIQNRLNTNAMQLVYDNGIFFEFVPFNENNFDEDGKLKHNPRALTIDEVEENINYAIVITTCSGAWRYLIGDTVMFIDKEHCEIIITGRTKHFLSICGEHLSVGNMTDAMKMVEEELGINIREFTVSGAEKNGRFHHKWYIGCQEPLISGDKIQPILDKKLCKINDDYATERSAMLGMEVVTVPNQLFYDWYESKGKLGGQNKIPRVMKAEQFADWEAFVAQQ